MDKRDFFHKLKGLRASKAVEQTLFLSRTKTGKKIRDRLSWQFHTFDPVDIQQLIHKRPGNREFGGRRQLAWSTSGRCCGHERIRSRSIFFVEQNDVGIDDEKFFFDRAAAFKAARQVYNQKLVYRIMVIVNGATLLWISRVFSTTSNVYGSHKPVGWSCMCLVAKLDKNPDRAKNRSSSHFVPVDIHTLIHSPATPC